MKKNIIKPAPTNDGKVISYKGDTKELYDLPPDDLMILSVNWADPDRFISRGLQSIDKVVTAFERAKGQPMLQSDKVIRVGVWLWENDKAFTWTRR